MALPPYFDRVYSAVGRAVSATRDSLEKKLAGTVVHLCWPTAPTGNERVQVDALATLLPRLYPAARLDSGATEVARVGSLMRARNPEIELLSGRDTVRTEFAVACGSASGPSGCIRVSSSGWVGAVDEELRADIQNPIGAAAAGCLAAAELFRRVFLGQQPSPPMSLSLLDYSVDAGRDDALLEANLNGAAFIGVGAVANGALWALSRLRLSGRVHLVDHEKLTLANLQRYVLWGVDDVAQPKAELAARLLVDAGANPEPRVQLLEDAARKLRDERVPTYAVSVDNVAGRRSAQALLPKLLVNGWTGEQSLGASWHELDRDAACLACLYHPAVQRKSQTELVADALGLTNERAALLWMNRKVTLSDDDLQRAAGRLGLGFEELTPWRGKSVGELYTDVVCGAVKLDLHGLGRVESVPLAHQSMLAGVMMAGELLKRTTTLRERAQPEALVSYGDILRQPPRTWRQPRAREPGCLCGDVDYQDVYREKWLRRS